MRTTGFAAAAFAVLLACGPVHALEASDTMAVWRSAPTDARIKLVTDLLKRDGLDGSISRVMQCLDAAGGVPGHADLSIRQVVEACARQAGDSV